MRFQSVTNPHSPAYCLAGVYRLDRFDGTQRMEMGRLVLGALDIQGVEERRID